MYWSDTSDYSLTHEERSLWIFFFMICVWHIFRCCVQERSWSFCHVCTCFDFDLFVFCLMTLCLHQWLSQGIYSTNYWPYLASPTAVYVIIYTIYYLLCYFDFLELIPACYNEILMDTFFCLCKINLEYAYKLFFLSNEKNHLCFSVVLSYWVQNASVSPVIRYLELVDAKGPLKMH